MEVPLLRLLCRGCGRVLSRPVIEVVSPYPPFFDEQGDLGYRTPDGSIEPRERSSPIDGTLWRSGGDPESFTLSVADVPIVYGNEPGPGLATCGDRSGCCGVSGNGGPNLECACGEVLATESRDCCVEWQVRVEATKVRVEPAEDEGRFPWPRADLGHDPLLLDDAAAHVALHTALGCSDWHGSDVGALILDRVTATDEPLLVVWWHSQESRAHGVSLDPILEAFERARRMHHAPLVLLTR